MEILSKRTRYALHGVAYLAAQSAAEPVSFDSVFSYLKVYSGRQSLSRGYVAKIFQALSKAGLVVAVSGPRGGYRLARPPGSTRLIEIIEVLDGPVLSGCCMLSVGDCSQEKQCGVGGLMQEAERSFYDFFQKKTVAALVRTMSFPAPASRRRGRSPDANADEGRERPNRPTP